MLLVAPEARIGQQLCDHLRQPDRFIEFSVRQQPGVGRDPAAQEFQLQAAAKTDPQIALLAVTQGVSLSAWHK